MRPFRRNEQLVGVAGEVRKEGDRRFVLANNTLPFVLLRRDDVLE